MSIRHGLNYRVTSTISVCNQKYIKALTLVLYAKVLTHEDILTVLKSCLFM